MARVTNLTVKIPFSVSIAAKQLASELNETEGKILQILNSLSQPLQFDMRNKFEKPVFRRGITSMADLSIGTVVTGNINLS